MKTAILLLSVAASAVVFSGCTSTAGRTVYTRSQVNQAFRVELGTVTGVRKVVIDGQATQIGMYGGGAIGAIGTSSRIGGGSGSALAGAAGGTVGAIVGREVEKAMTREPGLEITITFDDGTSVIVVQEEDRGGFQDGDRVRVMMGGGTAYVLH